MTSCMVWLSFIGDTSLLDAEFAAVVPRYTYSSRNGYS